MATKRMKILRTFKVCEKNNRYCFELVHIADKFCTYVTHDGSDKLLHLSDTYDAEKLYFNNVVVKYLSI